MVDWKNTTRRALIKCHLTGLMQFICFQLPKFGLVFLLPHFFNGSATGQSRILSWKTSEMREEIVFLNAKDKPSRSICLFPRTAESIEPYFVSSTSENPLEDFHAAVAEIRLGEKPATIVFDGGIYDFSAEDGAFLNLRNCSDLKVIGNGSHLKFGSPNTGFRVSFCNRVQISDFIIDYQVRVASFGTVISDAGGGKKILLDDEYWNQDEESNYYRQVTSVYPQRGDTPFHLQAKTRWNGRHHGGLLQFDSETKTYVPSDPEILDRFGNGEEVTIKHFEYGANAFSVLNSNDISIQKCSASDIPGMFLFARGCDSGILLQENTVKPDADDPLSVVAAAADGIHLNSVRKNIIVRNNAFSALGDDAINIHSNYWMVTSVEPGALVIAHPKLFLDNSADITGSRIELLSPGLKFRFGATVTAAESLDSPTAYRVFINRPIENVQVGDLVNLSHWQARKFVILNNLFTNFWGRGILVQARNGLVERNRIRKCAGCGIALTTDNREFGESGSCKNVVLFGNLIANSSKSSLAQNSLLNHIGAISITALLKFGNEDNKRGYSRSFLHSDILIARNVIKNCGGPGLFLSSVRNAKLTENVVVDHSTVPFSRNQPGVLAGITETSGYLDAIYDFHSLNTEIIDP